MDQGENRFRTYFRQHILNSEIISVEELVECYHILYPHYLCPRCVQEVERRVWETWDGMDHRSEEERIVSEWQQWERDNNIMSNEEFMERVLSEERKNNQDGK